MDDKVSRNLTFDEVLQEEIEAIRLRRKRVFQEMRPAWVATGAATDDPEEEEPAADGDGADARLRPVRNKALDEHHVGLAFSGGGVRSATFAVGILQGLASLGLLKRADYLSTVSGGGYAGGWLAAWLKREGSVTNVEKQLSISRVAQAEANRQIVAKKFVADEEPEPIYHLRSFSRFLAPRSGILTTDTWSIVSTYLRNVSINLIMLLPAAMVIVFLVRALVWLFRLARPGLPYDPDAWVLAFSLGLLGAGYLVHGLWNNARGVNYLRHPIGDQPPIDKPKMLFGVATPALAAVIHLPLGLIAISTLHRSLMKTIEANHHAVANLSYGVPWISGVFHHMFQGPSSSGKAGHWFLEDLERSQAFSRPELSLVVILAVISYLGLRLGWWRWKLVILTILLPVALSLFYNLFTADQHIAPDAGPAPAHTYWNFLWFPLIFGTGLGVTYMIEFLRDRRIGSWRLMRSAFISGAAGGLLLALVVSILRHSFHRPEVMATFAPPACLLVIVAATIFHVAQLRHTIHEEEREWWAYFDAYMVILALAWLAVFGTILYLPAAVIAINNEYIRTGVAAGLVASWAGMTIAGILAGSSRKTGGGGSVPLETIAAIAPPVFLAGLFALLSALVSYLIDSPEGGWSNITARAYLHALGNADITIITIWALVLGLFSLLISNVVDVNLFSLNAMYTNRLVRSYLGASRRMGHWAARWGRDGDRRVGGGAPTNSAPPTRRPNPVTGFDPADDVPLAYLQIGATRGGTAYYGPQLLINTSLNLVATADLAWTDRKSESFVLSPLHCGSKGTGYARVTDASIDELTLGRAMAISGAAVDPNMNYHQSPALTAFLTVFNARLGYWLQNPWQPPDPTATSRDEATPNARVRKARRAVARALVAVRRAIEAKAASQPTRAAAEKRLAAAVTERAEAETQLATARTEQGDAEARVVAARQRIVAAEGSPLEVEQTVVGALKELHAAESARDAARAKVERLEAEIDRITSEETDAAAVITAAETIDAAVLTTIGALKKAEAAAPPSGAKIPTTPWTGESPQYGSLLITELLGKTDGNGPYVHLTDGGHFENTGVYELVRRRCRYIVACDANTDRTASDENLANLVRLVRIDFGIRIQLDTAPLRLSGDDRISRSHVVIGQVRYDDVDNGQVPGVFVYIRTSMTGDESSDIQNYAAVNKEFPYTSSANQFFDESQFESYRSLGNHVARAVFDEAQADAARTERLWTRSDPGTEFKRGNKELFAALGRRWGDTTPAEDDRSLDVAREWSALHRELRTDDKLARLSRSLYPEVLGLPAPTAPGRSTDEERRVELHAVGQMLQIMENAWLTLKTRGNEDNLASQGWMNVFRRWTTTEAFHRHWPTLRSEFSTEFVRFCEAKLRLVPAMPEVRPLASVPSREVRELIAEFDREWPSHSVPPETGLEGMIDRAKALGTHLPEVPAWAIVQGPSPDPSEAPIGIYRGIMLAWALTGGKDFELLIWIRRAHRSIGLGGFAIGKKLEGKDGLLTLLKPAAPNGSRLYVRYPTAGTTAEGTEQAMWKSFFSLYDFRQETCPPTTGRPGIRLYRSINPP
jgi:predicted acylesterase/phospholipase RssA